MRVSWTYIIRVCREVAYGIDSVSAIRHGQRPAVPPYPPPSLFSAPTGLTVPPSSSRPPVA